MAFETSLVTLSVCLMTWIIQMENGGVLNILFKPDQDVGVDAPTFSIVTNFDCTYFTNLLLLKSQSFPVLAAIPERFGGGQEAVNAANAKPNREPILFWTVISISLLFMLLLICTTCCCTCGWSIGKRATIAKEKFSRHQLMGRLYYIILAIFAISIALVSICFLVLYFGTIGSAFTATEQTSSGSEHTILLSEGIQTALDEIQSFVKEGSATFPVSINASLTDFMDKVSVKVSDMLSKVVDSVLNVLNFFSFRENGTTAVNVMSALHTKAEKALQDIEGVKGDLINLHSDMTKSNNQFKTAFKNVPNCASDQVCSSLKAVAENLALPFDPNQIDPVNLVDAVNQLQNLQTKLRSLIDKYTDAIDICSEMSRDVSAFFMGKIDLGKITEMVDDFAINLESKMNDTLSQVQESIDSISPQIMQYKDGAIIALYCAGVFIILLVFIAISTIIRLMHLAWSGEIFSNQDTIEIKVNKWDSVVYGKGSAWCCCISLILLLFLSTILISLLLFVLTIVAGEGCIYVMEEDAMGKTDAVLNGYITKQWDSIIEGANTEILSKVPPNDILQALAYRCQGYSVGLFFALNIQTLFNRSAIVHRPEIDEAIAKGQELLLSDIQRQNLSQLIPCQGRINKMKSDWSGVSDQFSNSLTSLLQFLDPSRLDDSAIENLLSDLKAFINTPLVTQKSDFDPGLQTLEGVKSSMSTLKVSLTELRSSVENIGIGMTKLEPQMTNLINLLEGSLKVASDNGILTAEINSQYSDFVIQFHVILETDDFHLFGNLTHELFPCHKAHAAYRAIMSVTCDPSGAINHAIGFIIIFAFTILFLILTYVAVFNLAAYQGLQVRILKNYIQNNN